MVDQPTVGPEGEERGELRAGDEHMARVDVWAEDMDGLDDPAERRVRLRGMARSAASAAEAYAEDAFPWGAAEAEMAQAYAHAALAELESGDAREAHGRQAVDACERALGHIQSADSGRLSTAAAVYGACAEVLLQLATLQGRDRQVFSPPQDLVTALSEGMAEALWWDTIYAEEGEDLADMAEIVEAVADLEDDGQGKALAAEALYDLADEASDALRQTGDVELATQMVDLARKAQGMIAAARGSQAEKACPRCGASNSADKAFCTACGAPLPAARPAPIPAQGPVSSDGELVVVEGPRAGQRLPLGDGLRIGRAGDNDLVLAVSMVSRYHAEVQRTAAGYAVLDLGSSNGTAVNGERIDRATPLAHGDRIGIGHVTLQVELPTAHICPSCGAALRPGSAFCSRCGAQVQGHSASL